MEARLRNRQLWLIAHGAGLMIVGMLCGFLFTFYLLGEIRISPLPFGLDLTLPGSERGWRAAHLGNLLNGLMIIAIAGTLGLIPLSERSQRWIFGSLVVTGWGNALFYLFGNLASNRGLSLGDNRMGEGSLTGALAYLPALAAATCVLIALTLVLLAAVREARAAVKAPPTPSS